MTDAHRTVIDSSGQRLSRKEIDPLNHYHGSDDRTEFIATINGEHVKVIMKPEVSDGRAFGTCEADANIIMVDSSKPLCYQVDTLLHEALHQSLPCLSEEFVDQLGTDLTRLLVGAKMIHAND